MRATFIAWYLFNESSSVRPWDGDALASVSAFFVPALEFGLGPHSRSYRGAGASLSGTDQAKRTASPLTLALSPLRGEGGATSDSDEPNVACRDRRRHVGAVIRSTSASPATPSPLNGETAGVRGEDPRDLPCNIEMRPLQLLFRVLRRQCVGRSLWPGRTPLELPRAAGQEWSGRALAKAVQWSLCTRAHCRARRGWAGRPLPRSPGWCAVAGTPAARPSNWIGRARRSSVRGPARPPERPWQRPGVR